MKTRTTRHEKRTKTSTGKARGDPGTARGKAREKDATRKALKGISAGAGGPLTTGSSEWCMPARSRGKLDIPEREPIDPGSMLP